MRGVALILAIAAIVGGATWYLLRARRATDTTQLRDELGEDLEQGGVADLGRAQTRGRRLVLADPHDRGATAGLALVNALLAVDYGVDTARETDELLAQLPTGPSLGEPVAALAAAARALGRLRTGDRTGAIRDAAAAAAAAPGVPYPLYALGRARALAGDLAGAQRAFEAAIVGAPGFRAARVAWAEVRLDLGDARTARETLAPLVAEAPKDLRALLLLHDATQALGEGDAPPPAAACAEGKWPPPALTAACARAQALQARQAGRRAAARERAEAAARLAPDEPRLLGHVALTLAQMGAVDRAAALHARAARLAAPESPALAWAAAAIALGRGRAGTLPGGARPADPETRLLAARTAFAAGGVGTLGRALDALGPAALARDSDLRALARLRGSGAAAAAAATAADDPLAAYVDGLQAQLGGDLPTAATRFGHALAGHGDACRAAGEYVATLRTLKRRPDRATFDPLRGENSGCINLKLAK